MSDFTLVLGNKKYSSWSVRAWLAARQTCAPFDEIVIPLDNALGISALIDLRQYIEWIGLAGFMLTCGRSAVHRCGCEPTYLWDLLLQPACRPHLRYSHR